MLLLLYLLSLFALKMAAFLVLVVVLPSSPINSSWTSWPGPGSGAFPLEVPGVGVSGTECVCARSGI
jgi:hypothetical protein